MTDVAARPRLVVLDVLRGVAIALMVVDHVLVVVDPNNWLRFTATRWSLPLFMLVAGALIDLRGWPSNLRLVHLGALGFIPWSMWIPGMARLDVLLSIPLAILLVRALLRLTVGRVVPLTLAIGLLLSHLNISGRYFAGVGYDPALVGAWLALGMVWIPPVVAASIPAGVVAGATWLGRRPLSVYVGHLAVLALVVSAL